MKLRSYIVSASAILLLICTISQQILAQTRELTVEETILKLDSTFWVAYNNCDSEKMDQFMSADVEFYHDKGGATFGLENFSVNTKKNLCSNDNFRLKRDAVEGTVKVYPMAKAEAVYGAIISGDHTFTVIEKG